MTWRRAPLYVDTHDLAVWLAMRSDRSGSTCGLLAVLQDEARELVADIAVALSFPEDRQAAIRSADQHAARLRVFNRLAREVGVLRPNRVRHVAARLDRIGRMLGGWSRSLPRHAQAQPPT